MLRMGILSAATLFFQVLLEYEMASRPRTWLFIGSLRQPRTMVVARVAYCGGDGARRWVRFLVNEMPKKEKEKEKRRERGRSEAGQASFPDARETCVPQSPRDAERRGERPLTCR